MVVPIAQSSLIFVTPWTVWARQASLSMELSRQEHLEMIGSPRPPLGLSTEGHGVRKSGRVCEKVRPTKPLADMVCSITLTTTYTMKMKCGHAFKD